MNAVVRRRKLLERQIMRTNDAGVPILLGESPLELGNHQTSVEKHIIANAHDRNSSVRNA